MITRVKMLKVKIKSLAAEARIIRLEEKRSKPGSKEQCELHTHRVLDVRKEQRLSLLAYAFIRGRSLDRCERHSATKPDWQRVAKLIEKFGVITYLKSEKDQQMQRFNEWKESLVHAG